MKTLLWKIILVLTVIMSFSCNTEQPKKENHQSQTKKKMTAKEILGNPNYLAISYGGYRHIDHDIEPTLDELKEDMSD